MVVRKDLAEQFMGRQERYLGLLSMVLAIFVGFSSLYNYMASLGRIPDFMWVARPLPIDQIRHEEGHNYIAFIGSSELSEEKKPSIGRLLENGVPIGPANTLHDQIRKQGGGRFSFWGEYLYFSASDNSNPLLNGRRYVIHMPYTMPPAVMVSLYVMTVLVSAVWLFKVIRRDRHALDFIFRKVLVVAVNIAAIAIILWGFEYYLSMTDPARSLPFDGLDKNGNVITWGHLVVNNQYEFRERDFVVPKPEGTYRIMVLGDSITWGQGLAVEERYTNLLEKFLREEFPHRNIEVLNFGLPGRPTVQERDYLMEYEDIVQPDLIVVGFCYNDLQPRGQDYTIEREQFDQKYGPWVAIFPSAVRRVGLVHIAQRLDSAVNNILEQSGVVPSWEVGLQRTYEPTSDEWQAYLLALRDIKTISDERGIPPPIFAVLNQGGILPLSEGYSDQSKDTYLSLYLEWYHQAEQAAKEAGFITLNYEKEFARYPKDASQSINVLDGHPSALMNVYYAEKLFDLIVNYVPETTVP